MKKYVIISLILAVATLCGCSRQMSIDSGESSQNAPFFSFSHTSTSSIQAPITDNGENVSSVTENTAFLNIDKCLPAQCEDLLNEMTNSGDSLTAYGELVNEAYSEPLSRLRAVLDGYNRKVSVVAYSLDNSKALAYNAQQELFCACTVKAPFALYSCLQMEKGIASLSTELTYLERHYESGTGDMQYSPFGTVFSMETAINKSMSISDNVGYIMTVDYFGRDGYNEWITGLGCPSLTIKPTVWSLRAKARELAVMWREIYNYFSDGSELAKFLYGTCTNTAGNFATASLSGVDYSHKQGHNSTGDWLAYCDAGIVWGERPYIIVILTDAPGPSSYDAQLMTDVITIINNELI